MAAICLYFQLHQPWRLKRFSYFDHTSDGSYFDDQLNASVISKIAKSCYLPATNNLIKLTDRYPGEFKFAVSVSGTALEQFMLYEPEVIEAFQILAESGAVEFLAETYYHSLASVFNEAEFIEQVARHQTLIRELFKQSPLSFRNTELIYNDKLAELISGMGFKNVMIEGAEDVLAWRSPYYSYRHPQLPLNLFLRSYRLSDDLAFRFSDTAWSEYPLNSSRYFNWLYQIADQADMINLFLSLETFGERNKRESGIFNFFNNLVEQVSDSDALEFKTPVQCSKPKKEAIPLSIDRLLSWGDRSRDLSAWCGNNIQKTALKELYELAPLVSQTGDSDLLDVWRKLQTSDHFYYMSTKWADDGALHSYFNPYDGPYDAFLYFMNALRDFKRLLENKVGQSKAKAVRAYLKPDGFGRDLSWR